MIRPMNKYAFLIFHREYEDFLGYLQGLGVVHITQTSNPQEEEALKTIANERQQVKTLQKRLAVYIPQVQVSSLDQSQTDLSGQSKRRVEEYLQQYDTLYEETQTLRNQITSQEVWGDFDPELVEKLKESNYSLVAYTTHSANYTELYEKEYQCIPIRRIGTTQYFVRLETNGEKPCPEAEIHAFPPIPLSTQKESLVTLEKDLQDYRSQLELLAPGLYSALEQYDKELEDRFSFGATKLQGETYAEDKVIFLEGWIPRDNASELETQLLQTGYYYRLCDITESDKVPISLKNNVFAKGFELITNMFSLPNYGEIDQTILFAPFFMLFFGLCLGDAGYGLLILCFATYFRVKSKPEEDKSVYSLMQWLGGAAFVLGMLTGSLFGYTLPYVKSKDYLLNQDNLMLLSVILGLLQIFFAKGVAAYKTHKQKGLKYALAPMAWIIFLITLGVMLGLPQFGIVLPSTVHYILYTIVALTSLTILLYNSPGEGILTNIGSALWTSYNTASGLLGDTLSYIRLFAIGLTGAILGGVFNSLAIDSTEGLSPVIRFPLMLLILLAGHGINFGIAMIGALVHPIRLTFVEYYKNSEFEGGGTAYTPFKKVRKN